MWILSFGLTCLNFCKCSSVEFLACFGAERSRKCFRLTMCFQILLYALAVGREFH